MGPQIITLLLLLASTGLPNLTDLSQLQWKNRLILIQAEAFDPLQRELRKADQGVRDRHILWFILTPEGLATNYPGKVDPSFLAPLNEAYFENPAHRVVLIGKDGTVKDECSRLDLPYLFYLIDQMPMRQQEMKHQKEKGARIQAYFPSPAG